MIVAEDTTERRDSDPVGSGADRGPVTGDAAEGDDAGLSAPIGRSARIPPDDLGAARAVARAALIVLTTIALSLVVQLALVSGLQHRVAQRQALNHLRNVLAQGTAPVSQTTSSGRLLALGTPVALIDLSLIHI